MGTGEGSARAADLDADRDRIRSLFWEYLQWANARVEAEFDVTFDIAAMLARDMAGLEVFAPPEGRIVLWGAEPSGIGCLKRSADGVGEIKRMYVRPDARGAGAGRAILDALIEAARAAGYRRIRLDSAGFMVEAHALYRSAGFRAIAPYPESEIPAEFQRHWLFMALDVAGDRTNDEELT